MEKFLDAVVFLFFCFTIGRSCREISMPFFCSDFVFSSRDGGLGAGAIDPVFGLFSERI